MPQTFLLRKVMRRNSRCPGFSELDWGHGLVSSSTSFPGSSLLGTRLCRLQNHQLRHLLCKISVWPRAKLTHFKLRKPNFEVQKSRQGSAFDSLRPYSCVHQDISKQTGQNYYFLLHRHFKRCSKCTNVISFSSCCQVPSKLRPSKLKTQHYFYG